MATKKDFKQALKTPATEARNEKYEEIPLIPDPVQPGPSAAAAFISPEIRHKTEAEENVRTIIEQEKLNIPRGWALTEEVKSARMQLLIKPSTKAALKDLADRKGVSVNQLVNTFLEEGIDREEKK